MNSDPFKEKAFSRFTLGNMSAIEADQMAQDALWSTIREKVRVWVNDDLTTLDNWILQIGDYVLSHDLPLDRNDLIVRYEQRFNLRKRVILDIQYRDRDVDPCGYCSESYFVHTMYDLDHRFLRVEKIETND